MNEIFILPENNIENILSFVYLYFCWSSYIFISWIPEVKGRMGYVKYLAVYAYSEECVAEPQPSCITFNMASQAFCNNKNSDLPFLQLLVIFGLLCLLNWRFLRLVQFLSHRCLNGPERGEGKEVFLDFLAKYRK